MPETIGSQACLSLFFSCSELDCELSEEDWKKYVGMNNLSSPVREKERGNPLLRLALERREVRV